MKTQKLIAAFSIVALATHSSQAQSAFRNLNFEKANPVNDPNSIYYPNGVTAASALPYWTVYLGTVQQTDVIQNANSFGEVSVDIFGPNFAAATPIYPGVIDGNYSVFLEAGGDPTIPGQLDTASISQTGLVPVAAQSMEFLAWTTFLTQFTVSLDGNNLSPVALGSGPNYTTLYGVNISSYAGQTSTLEFTADNAAGSSWLGLDDITFSSNAIPEPSILSLTAFGGLLFGARKRFGRRR